MKSGSGSTKRISQSRRKPSPAIDRQALVELLLEDSRHELGMGPAEARRLRKILPYQLFEVDTFTRTRGDGAATVDLS